MWIKIIGAYFIQLFMCGLFDDKPKPKPIPDYDISQNDIQWRFMAYWNRDVKKPLVSTIVGNNEGAKYANLIQY